MDNDIFRAHKDSLRIGQCGLFKGTENINDFCRLIYKAQGIEYMIKHNFPNMEIIRSLAGRYDVTEDGVFVDRRDERIFNRTKVCLFNSTADVWCYDNKNYTICVLKGSKAVIHAGGYAVVRVEKDDDSDAVIDKTEHAVVVM